MSRPRRRKPTKASSFTRTCSIPREHLGLALSSPLESIALVSTRITEKGQVTVPIEVRRSLGLEPGDEVEFILDGPGCQGRPGGDHAHPGAQADGSLAGQGRRPSETGDVRSPTPERGATPIRRPGHASQGAPDTKKAPVGEPRPDRQDQRRSFLRSPRKFPQADAANSR